MKESSQHSVTQIEQQSAKPSVSPVAKDNDVRVNLLPQRHGDQMRIIRNKFGFPIVEGPNGIAIGQREVRRLGHY